MSILIVADHDGTSASTGMSNILGGASQLKNKSIDVLVIGYNCQSVVKDISSLNGINQILLADNSAYDHLLAENVSLLISEIASNYTHIIFPANTTGKNIMPRLAGILDIDPISDVIEIVDTNTLKRPIYAGNAIATVKSSAPIKIISLRTTAFNVTQTSSQEPPISEISLKQDMTSTLSVFIKEDLAQSDRPELSSAKIVVSGGRGLGSKENFELLYTLSDKLGAAVGASRAAVDAGFVPNDMQVGQTGKVVAPDLYIAVGISGAIQHLAGMKDSKIIVAINQDAEAPIFQIADYGLVADLFEAIPQLTAAL